MEKITNVGGEGREKRLVNDREQTNQLMIDDWHKIKGKIINILYTFLTWRSGDVFGI